MIGLQLSFEERRTRNTEPLFCVLEVRFGEGEIKKSLSFSFNSWDSLKHSYPDLSDILGLIGQHIESDSNEYYNNTLYIESISGHEELYEYQKKSKFLSSSSTILNYVKSSPKLKNNT